MEGELKELREKHEKLSMEAKASQKKIRNGASGGVDGVTFSLKLKTATALSVQLQAITPLEVALCPRRDHQNA
ncbi:hypothetical protein PT974_07404 [Cladobotryum mycophilum]|uniref:Uncharacterized protein n=1 Tax=Cladobotryum mycophilum TaxID=491253 RepID=A0ABR0SQG7_9HYPO